MSVSTLNPFPDYAVTRLAAGQESDQITIVTPAIAMGRELVKKYVATIGVPLEPGQTNAALCAVRGDYGTGKTHLLNYVASQIEAASDSKAPDSKAPDSSTGGSAVGPSLPKPSILRATCIETDALSWFRAKIGPRLNELPLDKIALRLYGEAGKIVARSTQLTAAAADLLQQDPARIRDLIRTNHLSIDEVGREFEKQLGIICQDYDPTVRRILSRLVSSETEGPARKWIGGATLSARDAELLGVPASIDSADQASAVVGAIATMHRAVGCPFVLLVDEFEHFTRYDQGHKSGNNVTWLKRLLEELGSAGALALVAGHWSAWETTKDYLDRFPQYAPIDLVKLEPDEVVEIVKKRLDGLPQGFKETHAQVIATVTGGNMRRIMSLCNLLFRQTDGFTKPLTEKQIHEAWTSVAQRIPQQQALEQIDDLLESRRFEVKLDQLFQKIPFDLVAARDDGRAILVQARHSSTQGGHYDAARKFIDKLAKVGTSSPNVIGMFLANGSIDDELLGILRSGRIPNLRWFDLTARDVMERIKVEIAAIDGPLANSENLAAQSEPGTASAAPAFAPVVTTDAETDSARLKTMNAELEQKLRELDARRQQETQALKERLDRLAADVKSPRLEAVRGEATVSPERARASYEAMLEEPSLNKKLGYLGKPLVIGISYVVFGLTLLVTRDLIAEAMLSGPWTKQSYQLVNFALVLVGISFPIIGLWGIWRRYSQVADYFEFSRQTIRDLYVRDVPIPILSRVNTVLRREIDRRGVNNVRRNAIEQLEKLLSQEELPPPIRNYVNDFLR